VAAVVNALSRALYGAEDATADEVRFWFELPNLEMLVLAMPDGRIAGYADLTDQAEHGRFWIDLRVPPGERHDEVAGALLDALEVRARVIAADAVVKAFVPSVDKLAVPLLERRGFTLVRHSYRMVVDLDAESQRPSWPGNIMLRAFVPGKDDKAVYEAHQESFADQFESAPEPYPDWRVWAFHEPFDPQLWLLAYEGDEIAGVCLCRPEEQGDPEMGWVSVLAVRRHWRRRGLGLALLLHAFAEFRARGKRRVGLGVDASNPTGAVRLYERAGMSVARRYDQYEKPLV
jgi:mycothiol synthase